MCKALEDMVRETARNTALNVIKEASCECAIRAARHFGANEEEILEYIMGKYDLSKEETEGYMSGENYRLLTGRVSE
ncbi:MAG: hypothetical protein LUF35_09310 [Lachnospiraceae bacterium]|nr:hypothetical protein [Lachnospiraceae bacterium]